MKVTFDVDYRMPVDSSFFTATHTIEIDDNVDAQQAANEFGNQEYSGFLSAVITEIN
ncbi:hypothetical protein ABMX62_19150 [Vibrio vulnificus]|uniref:hypothetical protein n=1 Tax=Vibrio vulnificus TaxID=672 RepID=UPI0040590FA3